MTIPPVKDAQLREALRCAHLPSLINSLVHLSGDLGLIRGKIRPQHGFLIDEQCGISAQDQANIRKLAFDMIRDYQSKTDHALASLSEEAIQEMTEFILGGSVDEAYGEMLTRELALHGEDTFAHDSFADIPKAARTAFRVIIIGAGMSGLLAGKRLKDEGIDFLIIDKNPEVGGTWLENTYPGCRVDSANHMYSYSFDPFNWPQHFSDGATLLGYFQRFADKYGLRENLCLNCEVSEAEFDAARAEWTVCARDVQGKAVVERGNALIMATGQLNRARLPDIRGREEFEGICFHSAEWAHEVDLSGKRIGVIGTGASALQFVPEIAKSAEKVTVFQRSPPWILHTPEYHDFIPDGKHWLLNHLPFYGKWYRFWVFYTSGEGLLHAVKRDPKWNNPQSLSEDNELVRGLLVEFVEQALEGRADLIEACIPNYPFGAKRGLRDNGTYFKTLKRDNLELVTSPIDHIHEKGIDCEDGRTHEFDVLIYGTGFKASDFFFPIKIRGADGTELREHWRGDPRAYLGITIPGYPNLFVLYGPNTNIVINASIIFFSECEVRYVMGCLSMLLAQGGGAMECRQAVHDAYNEYIDRGNEKMAWGTPGVSTWYKNAAGRVTQNWPFSMLEFWNQTKSPTREDFAFTGKYQG